MFPGNPGFPFNERSNDEKDDKEPYKWLLGCMYLPEQHTCELVEEQG